VRSTVLILRNLHNSSKKPWVSNETWCNARLHCLYSSDIMLYIYAYLIISLNASSTRGYSAGLQ